MIFKKNKKRKIEKWRSLGQDEKEAMDDWFFFYGKSIK